MKVQIILLSVTRVAVDMVIASFIAGPKDSKRGAVYVSSLKSHQFSRNPNDKLCDDWAWGVVDTHSLESGVEVQDTIRTGLGHGEVEFNPSAYDAFVADRVNVIYPL